MAKNSQKITYICSVCSASYNNWVGRCSQCQSWNSLVESLATPDSLTTKGNILSVNSSQAVLKTPTTRLKTIDYLDTVLGGGLMPGSVVLLSGQPGIGKSTILVQVSGCFSDNQLLYISGEESVEQVANRAQRLLGNDCLISLVSSNNLEDIVTTIQSKTPKVVIIDSIQTIKTNQLSTPSGSVAQINSATAILTEVCKKQDIALIIVGHVTKDGNIAGPKMLEHMVDVVLNLEGDRYGGFKVLRSIKNRYGSTSEMALLEMTSSGLIEVQNPSSALLEERRVSDGSVVLATMEGNRAVLVEIQALVNETSFGMPRRAVSGFDLNRLNLLIAVIEKRTKLRLSQKDIYVNIVGGLKITEPGADLAIVMAIASATANMQLSSDLVVFGEVGLSGEIRRVNHIQKRYNEAKKLGFEGCIGPKPASDIEPMTNYIIASDVKSVLNQFLQKVK